jgi:AcrR family transcriptional regulator
MSATDRSEQTRIRLLDAARSVVAREGWAGASSRAVAAQAGVNLALITYHFGSKADLLLAAFRSAVARLGAAAVPGRPGQHPLVAAILAGERIATDEDARVLLAACVEATRDTAVAEVVTEGLTAMRAMVLAQLGGGRRNAGLATLLAATMDGLLLHRAIDPTTDLRGAARALARLLDA